MATLNPFDLLNDDAEDPSQLAASLEKTDKSKKAGSVQNVPAKSAGGKLPSKPLPPTQAVREARSDAPRGGGNGGGFSRGRGNSGGFDNGYSGGYAKPSEGGEARRGGANRGSVRGNEYGGGRGGEYGEGRGGDGKPFERHSRTGRGSDFKRDGSGRGNWGTPGEEIFDQIIIGETKEGAGVENEKDVVKKPAGDDVAADANKENAAEVDAEKEAEEKQMTIDEYEKIVEEKKKALQTQTTSERKFDTKVFESMQQLSNKKENESILGGPGTQCEKIVETFGLQHLSAGDLLRREITFNTKNGAMILNLIKEEKIVPSEVTVTLIHKELELSDRRKFLIDGFRQAD